MTLFKQLAILVAVAFVLLASIILINDFRRTGQFLQGQMQTTARDMATTLGIAISNLPSSDDQALLEVLFNSVFDSGYYTKIELTGVDGEVIHQKSRNLELDKVPNWFLEFVPLTSSTGSTQIMRGWTQLGELRLSLHPGFIYSGLYGSFKSTLKWFLVLLILSILMLWLILHYLLQPLQRVREQADAIHRNQFVQQQSLPKTVELKQVIEAMNRLVSKVQGVFNDQEQTLAKYQQLLYHDKLTGLGNRRYMLDHLQQALSEESAFHGSLGIIKMINFQTFRDRLGYEASDNLARTMAELMVVRQADLIAEKTARLSDDEFAFLIAADENSVNQFIESIFRYFRNNPELADDIQDLYLVAGISPLISGMNVGTLLADVDYCLTQAANDRPYLVARSASTDLSLPQGKMQWRAWLEDIIHSQRLFLVGQFAIDRDRKPVQKELFIRTYNQQDQVISASAFMPMASSLGMALEIDKVVFRLVRENLKRNSGIPLALNLSAAFFEKVDAHEEFDQLLIDCHSTGVQLCIESSHHVLLQHPSICSQVSERVRRQQHQFGIDNLDFGRPLQILQSGDFDYAKINAATLKEMNAGELSVGYQALKTMTDTLDIRIIAVGVDSQTLFDELSSLGIEVMQGNFLDEAQPL